MLLTVTLNCDCFSKAGSLSGWIKRAPGNPDGAAGSAEWLHGVDRTLGSARGDGWPPRYVYMEQADTFLCHHFGREGKIKAGYVQLDDDLSDLPSIVRALAMFKARGYLCAWRPVEQSHTAGKMVRRKRCFIAAIHASAGEDVRDWLLADPAGTHEHADCEDRPCRACWLRNLWAPMAAEKAAAGGAEPTYQYLARKSPTGDHLYYGPFLPTVTSGNSGGLSVWSRASIGAENGDLEPVTVADLEYLFGDLHGFLSDLPAALNISEAEKRAMLGAGITVDITTELVRRVNLKPAFRPSYAAAFDVSLDTEIVLDDHRAAAAGERKAWPSAGYTTADGKFIACGDPAWRGEEMHALRRPPMAGAATDLKRHTALQAKLWRKVRTKREKAG